MPPQVLPHVLDYYPASNPHADSQEADWYPREKVDLAKKKLQGFNPAHLMKWVHNTHTHNSLTVVLLAHLHSLLY